MAKHRVEIDISFPEEKDALDLMNYIEKVKNKAYKPEGTEKIACYRNCRYHKCSHDDLNPTPCKDYIGIDFDAEIKEHKPKGG